MFPSGVFHHPSTNTLPIRASSAREKITMIGRSWRRISAATAVLGLLCAGMAAAQTPTPIPEQQYQPRPIPLGVSGGALDSLSAPPVYCIGGTLGALVADENGLQYVTGCNHVLNVGPNGNLPIGSEVVQPGLIDSGCVQNTSYEIGTLSAIVPLVLGSTAANKADAAMALVTPGDVSSSIFGIGQVSETPATPVKNLTVQKVGRTTGYTTGTIALTGFQATIALETKVAPLGKPIPHVDVHFVDLLKITPGTFANLGDSGALVFTSGSCPQPVGVVIAVSMKNGVVQYVLANPVTDVLAALAKAGKHKSVTIVGSSCTASAEMVAQASDLEKATADAEAVRKRHLAELMKIPHVTGVSLDVGPSEIIIDVWVDKPANVSEVERRVPSKLEGYDVDVLPEGTGIGA